MKSPGNFLVIDQETTKLLQVLARIHPYGNRIILKIILKFYIRLAKHSRKKRLDPLNVLEGIIENYLASDYQGFELKKMKRLGDLIEEAESSQVPFKSDEVAELKSLIKELRSSMSSVGMRRYPASEDFSPKEAAKLLKVEKKVTPKEREDYRQVRKKKRPRKIDF